MGPVLFMPPPDCVRTWNALPGQPGLGDAPNLPFVKTLEVIRYKGNSTLSAGGQFSTSGKEPIDNIARWDGTAWRPIIARLGGKTLQGVPGRVNAMAVRTNSLLIGGSFLGGMMEWKPPNLSVFTSARLTGMYLNGGVRAMITTSFYGGSVFGGPEVWLVGDFTDLARTGEYVPGAPGRLQGYAWYDGVYYGSIDAITAPDGATAIAEAESGDAIFIGGPRIEVAGLGTARGILYFNGFKGSVSSLGNGLFDVRQVDAILAVNGRVYVAGDFDGAAFDDQAVPNTAFLAVWDGERWSSVGVFDRAVRTLAAVSTATEADEIWAGGDFRSIDGETYNGMGVALSIRPLKRPA